MYETINAISTRILSDLWGEEEVGLLCPRDDEIRDADRHLGHAGTEGCDITMLPVSGDVIKALKYRGHS
jgi:hypothetical protein